MTERPAQKNGEDSSNPADICGQVLWGANNIFQVLCAGGVQRQCRLRGKTLDHQGLVQEHNPLICGDFVLLRGQQIYRRLDRCNVLRRRNLKRGEPQALAANIDGVILLVSTKAPALRPAFLDRLLIAAQQCGSPIVVLVNKVDTLANWTEVCQLQRFLRQYRRLGLRVAAVSVQALSAGAPDSRSVAATRRHGLAKRTIAARIASKLAGWLLRRLVSLCYIRTGRRTLQALYSQMAKGLYVVLGASGVGKSSLCNYFFPQQSQQTQAISEKWLRGVHTTTLARTLIQPPHRLIDTPGMRNFLPEIAAPELAGLQDYFAEFAGPRKLCGYHGCQHRAEPDCAVRDAAECELISNQRYQSYCKLYADLEQSLDDKPGYQTQNKDQSKDQSKRGNAPMRRKQGSTKSQGRRGDSRQSGLKARKQKRAKIILEHNDDYEDYE